MRRIVTVCLILGLFHTVVWAGEVIPLKGGDLVPPEQIQAHRLINGGLCAQHVLVQLRELPDAVQRESMRRSGLTLLGALPGRAYIASWDGRAVPSREMLPLVRFLGPIEDEDRMSHELLDGRLDGFAMQDGEAALLVTLYRDVDLSLAADVAGLAGGRVEASVEGTNAALVHVPAGRVLYLLSDDRVQFVEQASPAWGKFNDQSRQNLHAEQVWDPQGAYEWTGLGVKGFIYDVAWVDIDHPDLVGRVEQIDDPDYIYESHTSHCTCTFCGDGALEDGLYAGIAPGATAIVGAIEDDSAVIFYDNPADLEQDYEQAMTVHGADLSSNSIGSNITWNFYPCKWEGDYEGSARLIDSIVAGQFGYRMPVFWAAGNERGLCGMGFPNCRCYRDDYPGYFQIPPPVPAKNPITVGAVYSDLNEVTFFSSWGPTDDGRVKPTVVGPGSQADFELSIHSCTYNGGYVDYEGTSMASPAVAGVGALLIEGLREMWDIEQPTNDLVKALIIAGTEDMGRLGPDYMHGYGRVRADQSAELVRLGAFLTDSVGQGDRRFYKAHVESEDRFGVVLVWDDAPAEPNAVMQLVNDLDLKVIGPGNIPYHPFVLDPWLPDVPAAFGEDHINVEEQLAIGFPEPGDYIIVVSGHYIPEKAEWPFALAGVEMTPTSCDEDGDGYIDTACGGDDCNDSDAEINPGQEEVCDDGKDNDCDGLADGDDPDCAGDDDDDDDSADDDDDEAGDDDDDDNDNCCG